MKALVTGATGFVGRHLCHTLRSKGIEVRGLSSRDVDLCSDPASVEADFARILDSERPDVVFHLAGPKPYADFDRSERICVSGTGALIRAVERCGSPVNVIAAGSSTEYGYSTVPGHRLSEDDVPRPLTAYGWAKLQQTMAVLEAGGTVLRLFNCVGPGQDDDVVAGRIVRQLAEGRERLALRETVSKRDFFDVRDAAGAFVMAATSIPRGLYNVCSGVARGIDLLVEIACEAAGIEPIPIVIEMPDSEGSYQCGDPSRIESFGWTRTYDIFDSLRDAVDYERRRLYGAGHASET